MQRGCLVNDMTKKILAIVIAAVTLLIVALVGIRWYNDYRAQKIIDAVQSAPEPEPTPEPEPEAEAPAAYVSPIDFAELRAGNPDIYAWIRINDSCVDYPIVQRTGDNGYYLRRDFTGKSDWNGCIFTEDYNTLTFNDKVSVVYGHNIYSGKMFGDLIKYTDRAYFDSHDSMTVYLPDGEKSYTLVAAVTFDDRHLLHYSDYTDPAQFDNLVYQLKNTRNLTTVLSETEDIGSDDRLVILSTCYYNQKDKRFLVVWKETEETK